MNTNSNTNTDHVAPTPAPLPITADALNAVAGTSDAVVDYYDSNTKSYLVLNGSGRWLAHDVNGYKRILRSRGLKSKPGDGEIMSEMDVAILTVQNLRDVIYHGSLGGRNAGLVVENGIRALVTEDMSLVEPVKGNSPVIFAVLSGLLFSREEHEVGMSQLNTFYGWIKSSVEALRAGQEQQQQALALCGPKDCGKSLLQHLITEMLAGRSAKAERYFSGASPFNADLFGAEHLIIEDDFGSTRIADRLRFGARLKEHCVAVTTASLHSKGKNAMNLRPWWRVTITLNDDPEAMMILPPFDNHIADKIILLRASQFNFPMPVSTNPMRIAFRKQLSAEIPAFLYWLINEYEIPKLYTDPRRYNVATYHHPVLRQDLDGISPESDLLDLIDAAYAEVFLTHFRIELKAEDLENRLHHFNSRRTEKILSFRNSCGTYLGRLAKKSPDRVSAHRTSEDRRWVITAPPRNSNKTQSNPHHE